MVVFTWLQNMSAYSAGHTKRCGSKENSMASRKTDVFLASAMYS